MFKTITIIKREYLTRIRNKSFIIMTFLGPVFFAALFVLPAWFASIEDEEVRHIAIFDDTWLFEDAISQTAKFKFTYLDVPLGVDPRQFIDDFRDTLSTSHYFGFVYIPNYIVNLSSGVEFYSYKAPPQNLIMHIANSIEKEIEAGKLKAHNIENIDHILHSVKTRIGIRTYILTKGGDIKESHGAMNTAVGVISAMLTYMFIFMFGSQIMRGVIEEKTNRIVEVIVSSVKPFQLMMGKVIGVALVGLTQFLGWILLTVLIIVPTNQIFFSSINDDLLKQQPAARIQVMGSTGGDHVQYSEATETALEVLNMMNSINFGVLITCFLFFFIGGYLLYGSLFAAIGSAVDTEADTQQFMLPVTIPLIISIMIMVNVIQNPHSDIAYWFSIIPLTSPVVMMARIPFGVPYAQIAMSMGALIIAFLGAIWLSAKIYRTGILIYGKKMNYRELWKWLKY